VNDETTAEPRTGHGLESATGLIQLFALIRLFLLMVFPVAGAVMWLFFAFYDSTHLVFLVGIPRFVAGFVLAVRGWTRALRANREARRTGRLPGTVGVGTLWLSFGCTLVGFLVPLYLL
jgi:hypothetical protein